MASSSCASASLYDLVKTHWPAAVAANKVSGGGNGNGEGGGVLGEGTVQALLGQLEDLRRQVVEPNAAWFKNHTFSGSIVFPLSNPNDQVLTAVNLAASSNSNANNGASSSSNGSPQHNLADPVATSASVPPSAAAPTSSSSSTSNNPSGGRFRKLRRRNPQGQIPGGGVGGGSPSSTVAASPPAPTSTAIARVPRQFVYIYHSEVVGVQYQTIPGSNPNIPLPATNSKVSNPALLDPNSSCNTVTGPWDAHVDALPADLSALLVGCTSSPAIPKPAVSCFVLNVRRAPDCSVPKNCYGKPASIKSIMQAMADAPGFGGEAASPAPNTSSKVPVYVWVAVAGGALLLAGILGFVVYRKRRSQQFAPTATAANPAYSKLTPTHQPASSPDTPALSHPAATAQPASASSRGPHGLQALSPHKPLPSSLDRAAAPLLVPAAVRPPSHLLAGASPNTHMLLTTQTLETERSATSPPPRSDDLMPMLPVSTLASMSANDTLAHALDTTPVPLPVHLASATVRLHRASLLHHRPTRAFVGLSGDLGAHLSLQDLVDGWVSVTDLARAVARARNVPLSAVGQWVVAALDALVAPTGAKASPQGMVAWYRDLAAQTSDVGLAAGGRAADDAFVRATVVPALGPGAQNDRDRVRVATAAIVAFVRVKATRPFAVLCEGTPGEQFDVRVMKVEEHNRGSLARVTSPGGGASGVVRVKERVFPGVVDLVDGVVLAHARVEVD